MKKQAMQARKNGWGKMQKQHFQKQGENRGNKPNFLNKISARE